MVLAVLQRERAPQKHRYANRGGSGVCFPKGGGGQKSESKSGEGSMDLQGKMSDGRSVDRATEEKASEHEGGL